MLYHAGSAAGMESLEKVWNLFFSISRPGKSMEICEKLWKFQKRFGTFWLLPEKKIWRPKRCLDPARALRSCCREFDRKQIECHSVLSRLFLFVVQTAHGRPGAVCPPLQQQQQQQKGPLRTVRLSKKVRSQARPHGSWLRQTMCQRSPGPGSSPTLKLSLVDLCMSALNKGWSVKETVKMDTEVRTYLMRGGYCRPRHICKTGNVYVPE